MVARKLSNNQPVSSGPALDVHVAAATENLAAAAKKIEEASTGIKALINKAMAGKPVSKSALNEALETLGSATSSLLSFRGIIDSAAARGGRPDERFPAQA